MPKGLLECFSGWALPGRNPVYRNHPAVAVDAGGAVVAV